MGVLYGEGASETAALLCVGQVLDLYVLHVLEKLRGSERTFQLSE